VETIRDARLVRFGTFEVDLRTGELRKTGLKVKLSGQPFQVLAILLERPGEIVTREELQKRLWPETFVDVDHNLNTAINKIREVLGDSAENPRFVETLSRRGYRFIAPVERNGTAVAPAPADAQQQPVPHAWALRSAVLIGAAVFLATVGILFYTRTRASAPPAQRALTRLTFDDGLQIGVTWSPDSRFIAYSSDRGGKFDIWVQQVSGGDPLQITRGPGQHWQPDWSPDGKYIAYRSENGEGGLFIVPALGGAGLERKIASFGYFPRWSPDSSRILFQTTQFASMNRFYVADLDGSPPREVLAEILVQHETSAISAMWHPDGKRVSVWIWEDAPYPSFWTASIAGGAAVKSEIAAEIAKQLEEVTVGGGLRDFKFSWAPSATAIYFERTFRQARNIWRMSIDPQTLRVTAIERLTTGPGLDTEPSLSPDGKKLAFTGETQHVRAWLFPFDAMQGRVTGSGQAVTSPGIEAWLLNLSRDGKKLVFASIRAGKWGLWEKSLSGGGEVPITPDISDYNDTPQWSPDSTHVAYMRMDPSTGKNQVMRWSSQTRNEEPITAPRKTRMWFYDWSPDSKWLLVSQANATTGIFEIWSLPVAAAPDAEVAARRITSDPAYNLYQSHFSPDGRWIVFEAVTNRPIGFESTLYVMPAAGGPWTRITDSKHWDDKPRWSPDGKTIYFISGRSGFFNVWGVHFDPASGKPAGEPFPVTAFESPSLMVPLAISDVELSLTQDRLVLTVAQVSGSIWMLDNVDR